MADLTDRNNDVSIHGNGSANNPVAAIQDGSIYRLAVDAKISSDVPTPDNISSLVDLGYVYGVAANIAAATSGTHNPLLYIKNPSGSGKQLYLYRMTTGITVANVFMNFRLYANPTVSANGTALTISNRDIGHAWGASAMQAYSVPTVTSLGTAIHANWVIGQNTNSIDGVESFALHVEANSTILLTGNPSSNNREAAIYIAWAEF